MSADIDYYRDTSEYYEDEVVIDETEYTEEVIEETEYVEEEEAEVAPAGGMAAMIAAAANKRQNRLGKGGKKKVTHVEPPPNQGMDMAQMIAMKANARNDRIEQGGEVKVREVSKKQKPVFVDVALEAARVGTMTRLDEHTVVAVAQPKEEEVWKGPSGLRTDHHRSNFFMAINEAAALGKMKLNKPHEVTNYDTKVYHEEDKEPEDIDKMVDEEGRRVVRQLYLIDRMIDEERKYKKDEWSAENAANVVRYSNMESVALPSETAPKWRPKKTNKTGAELMEAISQGVAERAWERNYRLNRPKANLFLTRQCKCKFCVNPNPYQTHKYKQMEEKGMKKTEGPILDKEEEAKKAVKVVKPIVKETPNVKPGEWSESSSYAPVPMPIAPKKKFVPKPFPAPPLPPPPEPEPVQPREGETIILLDETTTWSHKRERKKPKKDKKSSSSSSKKKKKKKKGGDGGGGCMIM